MLQLLNWRRSYLVKHFESYSIYYLNDDGFSLRCYPLLKR